MWQATLCHEEGSTCVDRGDQIVLAHRSVRDILPPQRTRIVHQNINSAELSHRILDAFIHRVKVSQVHLARERFHSESLDLVSNRINCTREILFRFGGFRSDDDVTPTSSKSQGSFFADSTSGTGDNGNSSSQISEVNNLTYQPSL